MEWHYSVTMSVSRIDFENLISTLIVQVVYLLFLSFGKYFSNLLIIIQFFGQKYLDLEKRYEKLINFLTDYIYTVQIKDGNVTQTYHGPGCKAVTGYSSEDYLDDPELWYRMIHEDDREKALGQAQDALSGKDVQTVEHRIIHRDGSIRWVQNSIVITRNEAGEVSFYDGLIKDITKIKSAESEAEIRKRQLIQADKMASLGILIAGIAHEINNPNNFILLNARLFTKIWADVFPILEKYYRENGDFAIAGILYSRMNEKLNISLEGILTGSERIKKIVDNLTDYARTDSGKLDEEVDINKVVDMAIMITGNLIKRSTDKFTLIKGENIPTIIGNNQQLEQVIINLITNSCQSLRNSSECIELSTKFFDSENVIVITVQDKGQGIKEDDLNRIIDPFFTTKRDIGGTGLGLSISYNIIKSHSGDLKLESRIDQGTKAIVTLPVNRKDERK